MPRKTIKQRQAETAASLIQSADKIFCGRGYDAATLSEISDAAGYSTGAIYSNFRGKEDLFLACSERRSHSQLELWDEFFSRAEEIVVKDQDLAGILASVWPDPGWQRALLEFKISRISDEARAAILRHQQLWRSTIRQLLWVVAHSNGLTPVLSYEDAAHIVAGLADGLSLAALTDVDLDVGRIFAASVRVVLSSGSNDPNEVTG